MNDDICTDFGYSKTYLIPSSDKENCDCACEEDLIDESEGSYDEDLYVDDWYYDDYYDPYYDDYYDDDYYNDYSTEYKKINKSMLSNGIQITIIEGSFEDGYYNYYDLYLEFRNLGEKKKEVKINDAILVMDGKQYSYDEYYVTGELGPIYPEASIEEYLTFTLEEIGDNATLYLDLRIIEDDEVKYSEMEIAFEP